MSMLSLFGFLLLVLFVWGILEWTMWQRSKEPHYDSLFSPTTDEGIEVHQYEANRRRLQTISQPTVTPIAAPVISMSKHRRKQQRAATSIETKPAPENNETDDIILPTEDACRDCSTGRDISLASPDSGPPQPSVVEKAAPPSHGTDSVRPASTGKAACSVVSDQVQKYRNYTFFGSSEEDAFKKAFDYIYSNTGYLLRRDGDVTFRKLQ